MSAQSTVRADVFREHANFRVSHVFVFNSENELLLQRLAFSRDRNPGAWGSSVASYLFASEDYVDAACRRFGQELGVQVSNLSPLGKIQMVDNGCLKFITLFRSICDGPFNYDRSHIDSVEFVSVSAVEKMLRRGDRVFTPTFIEVFRFYRSLRLDD